MVLLGGTQDGRHRSQKADGILSNPTAGRLGFFTRLLHQALALPAAWTLTALPSYLLDTFALLQVFAQTSPSLKSGVGRVVEVGEESWSGSEQVWIHGESRATGGSLSSF